MSDKRPNVDFSVISISSEILFQEEAYEGLTHAEACNKAIELGWRWDIARGHWYRLQGY